MCVDPILLAAEVVATVPCRQVGVRFIAAPDPMEPLPWVVADDLERAIGFRVTLLGQRLDARSIKFLTALDQTGRRLVAGETVTVFGPMLAMVAAEAAGVPIAEWLRVHARALNQAVERRLDREAVPA